ncbi:hypothetical protein AYO20_01675 [Fonsecaea nubica]|uniref:Uncharacterized protein n=1 Tax=Fonsecaea nubica TaxID=856822 RepID=A0A178DC91_9EURO|nr:hypothetical protein AYO20_01675 [Fonsecaea nubica]OAL38924.1 hypothetical protein AYO20_01675 [Fonsecaea nubica]
MAQVQILDSQSSNSSILASSKACAQLLNECLKDSRLFANEWAPNQVASFRLWIESIGAFAPGSASADARLKDHPDMRNAVLGLLAVLWGSLQHLVSKNSPDPDQKPDSSDSIVRSEGHAATEDNINSMASTLELYSDTTSSDTLESSPTEPERDVEDALYRLHQLAMTIRKSSRYDQSARAARYIHKDAGQFRKYMEWYMDHIFKREFPDADEWLYSRLVESNMRRRCMFEYVRDHARKLAQGFSRVLDEPTTLKRSTQDQPKSQRETSVGSRLPDTSSHSRPSQSKPTEFSGILSATSASKYAPADHQQKSITSSRRSGKTFIPGKLPWPEPPQPPLINYQQISEGQMEALIFDKQQLDPSYENISWSHSSYEDHMKAEHRESFTDSQLPNLVERSIVRDVTAPILEQCPICPWEYQGDSESEAGQATPITPDTSKPKGKVDAASNTDAPEPDEEGGKTTSDSGMGREMQLRRHLTEHLQSIALLALPWETEQGSGRTSSTLSERASRETLAEEEPEESSDGAKLPNTRSDDEGQPPDPDAALEWDFVGKGRLPKEYHLSNKQGFSREDYSVAWICSSETEMDIAQGLLDEQHELLATHPLDSNYYALGRVGSHNVAIIRISVRVHGLISTSLKVEEMLLTYPSLKVWLVLGTGSGFPSTEHDIRLGDILVQVPSQHQEASDPSEETTIKGQFAQPPKELLLAVEVLQAKNTKHDSLYRHISSLSRNYRELDSHIHYINFSDDYLFHFTSIHVENARDCHSCDLGQLVSRPPRDEAGTVIHYGRIASVPQDIRDGTTREEIRREQGSLGQMDIAVVAQSLPHLTVQGVCDYADSHKDETWRLYSAAAAAAYAKELLLEMPGLPGSGQEPKAVHRVILPFPRNPDFTNPDSILDQIESSLWSRYHVALLGAGRAAKQQIAIEYAHRFMQHHSHGHVFWVDGSSTAGLVQGLKNITQALRIPILSSDLPEDHCQLAADWLREEKTGPLPAWLMILDNINDVKVLLSPIETDTPPSIPSPAQQRYLLDYLPKEPRPQGHMLITTRDRQIAERLTRSVNTIEIPESLDTSPSSYHSHSQPHAPIQNIDTEADSWFYNLESVVFPLLPICPRESRDRVKIALLCTGVDMADSFISFNCDRVQAKSFLPGIESVKDTEGYGTHSTALLLRVAPNSDIYVARVSEGVAPVTADPITQAITHATTVWRVDIICMIYGFTGHSAFRPWHEAIMSAAMANIAIFTPAGNDRFLSYPATRDEVIAISSATASGRISPFSPPCTPGKELGIIGEEVSSAWLSGTSKRLTGSSTAVTIGAAVGALLMDFTRQELSREFWYRDSMVHSRRGLEALLRLASREVDGWRIILPWILFEHQPKSMIVAQISRVLRHAFPEGQVAATALGEPPGAEFAGSLCVDAESERDRASLDAAGSFASPRKDVSKEPLGETSRKLQIQCTQELVVHGHLDGHGSENVSLIMLRFSFTPAERFSTVSARIEFHYDNANYGDSAHAQHNNNHHPVIRACDGVPSGTMFAKNTSKPSSLEEIFTRIDDNLSTASPAYGTEPATLGSSSKVSSAAPAPAPTLFQSQNGVNIHTLFDGDTVDRVPNVVGWTIRMNGALSNGIGDMLRVAVLVSRRNNEDFTMKCNVRSVVSSEGDRRPSRFREWAGVLPFVQLSPQAETSTRIPSFISQDQLGRFTDPAELRQLLYADLPDSGAEGPLMKLDVVAHLWEGLDAS